MVIFLNYLDMPSNTQGTPLALTYHDLNEKILNSVLATLANVIVAEQQEARLWSMISQPAPYDNFLLPLNSFSNGILYF